jgi:hypothetical protein
VGLLRDLGTLCSGARSWYGLGPDKLTEGYVNSSYKATVLSGMQGR